MVAVKAIVIGLGVLILIGVALLVYGIVQKAANPDFKLFQSKPAATSAVKPPLAGAASAPVVPPAHYIEPFGTVDVALGAGCRVAEIVPDGPRLYLRLGPAAEGLAGCDRIVVLNSATGHLLGTLRLKP
jgi:hypothetical protein